MPEAKKMVCPDCGVEMNYHAEKIDYTAALDDPTAIDPDLGGVLEEAHTCPDCGKTALRRASQGGEGQE
jgi:ssDNA-binding Zn-finger/Zn-ribbon topoisomerase 1